MTKWTQGVFQNGMAWSCYGEGEKVAIVIPGGPGNPAPDTGWKGKFSIKMLLPLIEEGYRLVSVARPRNMPAGHSVADMANDYACMIDQEFGGQVDLVIGGSYGGMISQYLAADHPNSFKHIVVLVAACEVIDPEGIDQRYARAIADGRLFEAGAIMSRSLYPDAKFPFLPRLMLGTMTKLLAGSFHEHMANDVVVEAEAERTFDAREALPRVTVPVLLIGGDEDAYFPEALTRETASLIPNCTLKLYEGQGHMQAAMDKRIAPDILAFIKSAAA